MRISQQSQQQKEQRMCEYLQQRIEACFAHVFYKIGFFIGRRGCLVALLTLLICCPLTIGWLFAKEFDQEQIAWSPENNMAIDDFNRKGELGLIQPEIVTFIYKAKNSENLLTYLHFDRIFTFHNYLLNYQNSLLKDSNCIKSGGRCIYSAHLAQYFEDENGNINFSQQYSDTAKLLEMINTARNAQLNSDIPIGNIFGGTTPSALQRDQTTRLFNLEQAKAIKFDYLVVSQRELSDYAVGAIDEFKEANGYFDIEIEVMSEALLEDALNEGIFDDVFIINISISLIVIYSMLVLGNCDPVGCRIWAPLVGIFSTLLAFVVAYGFCSLMGLRVVTTHNLLPFLLLGIGVDDMYVIAAVADQCDINLSSKQLIGRTLKVAGVSIFVTSLTDCIAFMVNGLSRLPSVQSFGIYAGMGVIFDFLFEITIFTSFLAMDLRRQKRGKPECCGLCRCKPNSCFFCWGKCKYQEAPLKVSSFAIRYDKRKESRMNSEANLVNAGTMEPQSPVTMQIRNKLNQSNNTVSPPKECSTQVLPRYRVRSSSIILNVPSSPTRIHRTERRPHISGSLMQKFLANHYSRCITHKVTIICVFLFFSFLTIFAAYGASQIEVNIELEFFVNTDHHLRDFINYRETYFPQNGEGAHYFTDSSIDVLTEANQKKYLDTINVLAGNTPCDHCQQDWIIDESLHSWFFSWISFVDAGLCDSVCVDSSGFVGCKTGNVVKDTFAKQCLFRFLNSDQGSFYSGLFIAYTPDQSNTTIETVDATVSQFTLKRPIDSSEAVEIMDETRQIATKHGNQNSFIFTQLFITWEQFKDFPREISVSLSTALIAIFLLLLVVSGSFCTSLLVFLMMALIDVNLLALLWYWDLELNFTTMVNIIFAIGVAVNYSSHIANGYNFSEVDVSLFNQSNFERRKSKVRGSFKKIGGSVFHGAFSTFLAIVAISASSSYIFQAFFRQWFGIVVFGILHGFVLLPCILCVIGPLKPEERAK